MLILARPMGIELAILIVIVMGLGWAMYYFLGKCKDPIKTLLIMLPICGVLGLPSVLLATGAVRSLPMSNEMIYGMLAIGAILLVAALGAFIVAERQGKSISKIGAKNEGGDSADAE